MASGNTGYEQYKILEGYYTSDSSLSGTITFNLQYYSPSAIVPDGTSATYNYPDDVAPTGGSDGDIWYNPNEDKIYKNISGTWTVLTDRILNPYYVAPSQDLTNCPLPWKNAQLSTLYVKDCSSIPGSSGTTVEYIVPYGRYLSNVSQSDADDQASADASANGQTYANTIGSCVITTLIGTLLIDYYNDSNVDLCLYCSTSGIAEQNIFVTAPENNGGSGVPRYPSDGRDPSQCYLLASNRNPSGTVSMRFGINMAYFITQYPAIDVFTFVLRGRSTSSVGSTGEYALRDISEGHLAMSVVTPGIYIPSVPGAGTSTITGYSTDITSGGDGTVSDSIGSPVLTLTYTVSSNTLVPTTY